MQNKLTLSFIGFALIPLFVILPWTIFYIQKDQTYSQAQDTARLIKAQVSMQVQERVRDLQSFALTETFWEDKKANLKMARSELETYSNALLATHPEYRLLLVVDQKGIVQVANTQDSEGNALDTSSLLGKSFDRSSWFQKAITVPEAFVETPKELGFIKEIYKIDHMQVMPVARAIRNGQGEMVGAWVIFTDASFLTDILTAVANSIHSPGNFSIYDGTGQALAQMQALKGEGDDDKAIETLQMEGLQWSIQTQLREIPFNAYMKIYFWPVLAAFALIILYAFIAARRLTIPLQRLVYAAEFMAKGPFGFGIAYGNREDEYGRLSRALTELQKIRFTTGKKQKTTIQSNNSAEYTSQRVEETVQLIHGLSAQANMLALNASMEAVKSHHLDEVAEKANELAQRTSYNSQELLKKLNDIKAVCDEIQNNRAEPEKEKKPV